MLGTKAGRRRYEQIAGTYRAVTESPAAKAVITAGRRKIANRVSPDPEMVTLTPIDAETAVLEPQTAADSRRALADAPVESWCRAAARRLLPSALLGRSCPMACRR